MPVYFGYPNHKGLEVSPLLKTKGINLLRASPASIRAVAQPLVRQPGYSSYSSFLPAFMKAQNEQIIVPLNKHGYTTNYPVSDVIDLINPSLVVDYNGPIPGKHTEALGNIGFERIKMNKRDNIVRFPVVSISEVRAIRQTSPNSLTPAPANTVNLEAFDSWVLFLRVMSNFLKTHIYPAFRDNEHYQEEVNDVIDMVTLKRRASELESMKSKIRKVDDAEAMVLEEEEEEGEIEETGGAATDVHLSKAKPIKSTELPWGSIDTIPNCSGIFFPYVAELSSPDIDTVPSLIEQYLFQSLGDTPEKQLERLDKLRRAWGLIGKTESGNVSAHMCKVIQLAIQSQARVYPVIVDSSYEGCVLLGARLFVGINGVVHRPMPFTKLQSELGSYSTHSRTLSEIAGIAGISARELENISTMRLLRSTLLKKQISEESRDNVRKLAVHLHFKERFLGVNSNSLSKLIDDLTSIEDDQDDDLPMHHSALFSNDPVFVALSAFGFQAPSFVIENCPKVELRGTVPNSLVLRQKPLDIACQDWKSLMATKEIRNNPRNLSRSNRDRSLTGNDKTVVWGRLVRLGENNGGEEGATTSGPGYVVDTQDNLDDW
uniref:Uncharacterized protein n=1 Tax=Downy mildew lesion associated ambivirus 1 TaxID=3070653 RepID=A0AA51UB02_9VIRU|nr:MAG: hypothetical protein [Downy mildew lesion associated ambivirus 1]